MQVIHQRTPSPMFTLAADDVGDQERQFPQLPSPGNKPLGVGTGAGADAGGKPGGMPRLVSPTEVHVSARGDDEVHPLAGARRNMQQQPKQLVQQRSETSDMSSLSSMSAKRRGNHTQQRPILAKRSSSDGSSRAGSHASSRASKAGELSSTQQVAMDHFLAAQGSGDPIAKEMAWRELVRAMRSEEGESANGGNNHNGGGKVGRLKLGRNASGGQRGRASGVVRSGKDDILGLIRIGGGLKIGASDAVSIRSGLTSAGASAVASKSNVANHMAAGVEEAETGGWAAEGTWTSTPGTKEGQLAEADGAQEEPVRSVTPPNVPRYTPDKGDLPLVSPLSLEDDWDANDLNEDNLNVTGETTLATSPDISINNDAKGKVFFDIGKGFTDNTWGLRKGGPAAPALDWDSPVASGPAPSLADLSDGESKDANASGPPAPRLSPRQRPRTLFADDDGWHTLASGAGIFAATNEGEVMSFQEMEDAVRRPTSAQRLTLDLSSPSPRRGRSNAQQAERPGQDATQRLTLDVSSSSRSRRKTRKRGAAPSPNVSLEEAIMSVLKQQPDSHVVEEDDEGLVGEGGDGVIGGEELFGRGSPLPAANKNCGKVKSGTVGSTASAQDILRELRSETPCTLHSGKSTGSASNHRPLPRSISIGKESQADGASSPRPPASEGGNGRRAAAALALRPSRRDLPRSNRVQRRGAAEPLETASQTQPPAAATESFGVARASPGAAPAQSEPMLTKARDNLTKSNVAPVDDGSAKSEDAPRRNSVLRGRLFPNTTPSVNSKGGRHPANPFDSPPRNSTNPFDSPPRIVMSNPTEDPFEEQSSPILPLEPAEEVNGSSYEAAMSMDPYHFEDPSYHSSSRDMTHSPDIEEIRASISQLKHNGVGGLGKKTSTLVRNEETGRYVIRDVDDDGWKELMQPKAIDEEEKDGGRSHEAIEGGSPTVFTLAGQLMEGSVLDDDAVDDAVRVATECLSTASTETKEEECTPPPPVAHEDEEDLFVVRRPARDCADWSAFGSCGGVGKNGGWDQWDVDDNDSFAPGPEDWDCDDTDGAGFDGGDCWGFEEKKAGGMFPSPTSVAVMKRGLRET